MGKKSRVKESANSHKEDDVKPSLQKMIECETIEEFIKVMTSGGKAKMHIQHDALRKQERHIFFFLRFQDKNRYSNMVLFNEGAVILQKEKEGDAPYYHASMVQTKLGKFILAQAPMEETLVEWYQMIWQQKVQIIVCLVNPQANKEECVPYFEFKKDKKIKIKNRFIVRTITYRHDGSVTNLELKVSNLNEPKSGERSISVIVYPKWTCVKLAEPRALISLLHNMWALEQSLSSFGENVESPILVHGSAGIRRTGAFVTIASVCRSIKEQSQVCVLPFITYIRRLRYGVMRNKHCFATTLNTILQFSLDQGHIARDRKKNVKEAIMTINDALVPDEQEEPEEEGESKKVRSKGSKGSKDKR